MTLAHLLILFSGTFGLYQLFRLRETYPRIILGTEVVAIGLAMVPHKLSITAGMLIYLVAVLLAVAYGLMRNGLGLKQRTAILSIAIPVLVALMFELNHWPFAGAIGSLMVVPIVAFGFVMFDRSNFKNEIGFLLVMVVEASVRFAIRFEWLNS